MKIWVQREPCCPTSWWGPRCQVLYLLCRMGVPWQSRSSSHASNTYCRPRAWMFVTIRGTHFGLAQKLRLPRTGFQTTWLKLSAGGRAHAINNIYPISNGTTRWGIHSACELTPDHVRGYGTVVWIWLTPMLTIRFVWFSVMTLVLLYSQVLVSGFRVHAY